MLGMIAPGAFAQQAPAPSLEEEIRALPPEELRFYTAKIGTATSDELAQPVGGEENLAYLQVSLVPFSKRDRDAGDVMAEGTGGADRAKPVATAKPGTAIADVIRVLARAGGVVAVVDKGRILGTVSADDIVAAVARYQDRRAVSQQPSQ